MKPSSYYDRVVDVMEELIKFTLLTRAHSAYLTSRYSERKSDATAHRLVAVAVAGAVEAPAATVPPAPSPASTARPTVKTACCAGSCA